MDTELAKRFRNYCEQRNLSRPEALRQLMNDAQRTIDIEGFMNRVESVLSNVEKLLSDMNSRKLGIPVFGLIDTNCDPDDVDYVLPANDDAVRSIKVVLGALTNAIIEANGGTIVDYVGDEEKKPSKEKSFAKKEN